MRRHTNEIHDLGSEDWQNMTRAKHICSCIPSKLTLTMFGSRRTSEPVNADAVPPKAEH